jgi:hypothetical protein
MIPNLILGGGPVGILLGAIYSYPVMTDKIRVPKGPVYLYDTLATRVLLHKLDIDIPTPKIISIGYFFRGRLIDYPTNMATLEYSLKVRKQSLYHPRKFQYFDISWDYIFQKAMEHIPEIILAEASTIDTKNRVIFDGIGNEHNYRCLISTIPAPIFKDITGNVLPWALKSMPVILKPSTEYDYSGTPEDGYDYVYFCSYDDPRIRWSSSGYIEMKADVKDANMWRIISGSITPVKHVKFMGRFARWDESRLISDDVAEAIGEKIEVKNA